MNQQPSAAIARPTRLARILEIVRLLGAGRSYNAVQLAETLGVSRRTVFRDLGLLRASQFPIHFDPASQHYFVTEQLRFAARLTPQDAISVAIVLAQISRQPELAKAANVVCRELVSGLDGVSYAWLTDCLDSIHADSGTDVPSPIPIRQMILVQSARVLRRKLRIVVEQHGSQFSTLFSPYGLSEVRYHWLAFGRSSLHRKVLAVKLDSIIDTAMTEDSFDIPSRESATRRQLMLDATVGNRSVQLKLPEAEWHARTWEGDVLEIVPARERAGVVVVTCLPRSTSEFEEWLWNCGTRVEVLRPTTLKLRLKERAHRLIRHLGGSE